MPAALSLVGDAIKLLIGDREEDFDLEKALRLFQLKMWLLEGAKENSSFRRAALIFASLAIYQEQESTSRYSRLTPSEELILAFASRKLRPLIDRAFEHCTIFGLTQIWSLPFMQADVEEHRKEIEVLNALTRSRLRLHFTGMDPSVNNGALLLGSGPDSKGRSERTSKSIRAKRRERGILPICRRARIYRYDAVLRRQEGYC